MTCSHTVTFGLQILQGLLTPVIAIVALYIAWQQYKVNERKFAFDQYERRLRVYQEVRAVLLLVIRDFKPEFTDLQKFRADTAEADFLFEPEIPAYLDEIVSRGWTLRCAREEFRDMFSPPPPAGYDHQKIVNEIAEEQKWFVKQPEQAKQMFKKYLYISR
jgi:hypothetical protein